MALAGTTILGLIKLADLLLLMVEAAPAVLASLRETRDRLVQMAEQGRDPTPAEWDELVLTLQANSDEIQAIRDAANRGQ